MGSGAFLVEACRLIATRLVRAWEKHKDARPVIPPDEDEHLHARRLVAQRCIYGVDKNPRAVDLARLSLWLVTLARDHEFTFLDHALKCGDSLLGLTLQQITATHWDTSKPPTFVGKLVGDHLKEAEAGRARIRDHPEGATEAELRPLLRAVDAKLEVARLIGDGVVAAFFHSEKKERLKHLVEFQMTVQNHLSSHDRVGVTEPFAARLKIGEHPIRPFHWPLEFPEVFVGESGGFDAMVGNPPFLGGTRISSVLGANYAAWLHILHAGSHGNADLVAHFFRRAFSLLCIGGVFGLIATNTIGQGDTRATGLETIIGNGGAILEAQRRLKWPGEAAVMVSVVHVVRGQAPAPILDSRPVKRISAYLVDGQLDTSPRALASNSKKAFIGSKIYGQGFLFDDVGARKGDSESIEFMRTLVEQGPRNDERIFPYIGGEEVNTDPRQAYHRYVIDFANFPLRRQLSAKHWIRMTDRERDTALREGVVPTDYPYPVAADWPKLLEIVERLVKPQREKLADNPDGRRRKEFWWRHSRTPRGLYKAAARLERVLVRSLTSSHFSCFAFLDTGFVYDQTLIVWPLQTIASFSILSSRCHEVWALFFGATLEDRGRYNIADCFRTFPFPDGFETNARLLAAGEAFYTFRSKLMIDRNEGLTKIYNQFHARGEVAPDITRLRTLQRAMDRAVLKAYGWDDLAGRATPEFIEMDGDEGKKPKTKLDWPAEFKDEVLARLLALNAQRAGAERATGIASIPDDEEDENEIDEEADA
jgi:hypothetical protein